MEESQPGTSQEAVWANFMEMAKAKGLEWAKGILNSRDQEDSGVVVDLPGASQAGVGACEA